MSDNPFAGTGGGKAVKYGEYEKPGTYIQLITQMKYGKEQTPPNHGYFLAEKKIVHVLDDSEAKAHPTGVTVTDFCSFKHASTPGNLKAMFCCLLSAEEGDQTESEWEETYWAACQPDQPFINLVVRCHVFEKPKRDKPGVVTIANYHELIDPATLEAILTEDEMKAYFPEDVLALCVEKYKKAKGIED